MGGILELLMVSQNTLTRALRRSHTHTHTYTDIHTQTHTHTHTQTDSNHVREGGEGGGGEEGLPPSPLPQ